MTSPTLCLGLGFARQAGKDTLAACLQRLDSRFTRFAFADPLKQDLAPFLLRFFGVDIWTCSNADKELVRPILIAYGMCQRARDPDYWVKRTVSVIRERLAANPAIIPVVTDVRFPNEVRYLREEFGALIVHVSRDGAPKPTEEEMKHVPRLIADADFHFCWGHDELAAQMTHAQRLMDWVNAETEQRCKLAA